MEIEKIITERLILRKIEQSDAPSVLKGLSNDELTKYMLIRYYNLSEVQEQMDYYANHFKNKTGAYWLIELKNNHTPIGVIGINDIHYSNKKCELGYWLYPEFWNNGYIVEAAKNVIDFCFDKLQLNRIEADVETENTASISIMKKLGFIHEGTLREYEMNNGNLIDLMKFALLKRDVQH